MYAFLLAVRFYGFFSFYISEYASLDIFSPLAYWVECLPMVWETGVQSQVNHTKDSKNET